MTTYSRSCWGMPPSSSSQSKPSIRRIPVAAPKPTASSKAVSNPVATPKPKASSNLVSIPVHFVGPERRTSDSALKIQKVLRGFFVRKSLKKIAAISNEVKEIESRVSDHETIDLIRRDSRERLRISETLMNLLLSLDSVTSVDFGVRSCRKSAIKKAIALQEKLDLIASSPDDSHAHGQSHGQVEVQADTNVVSQEVNSDLHDEAGDYDFVRSGEIPEFQSPVKPDDDVICGDHTSELRENVEASVPGDVIADSDVSQEKPGQEASTASVEEEKEVNSLPEIEGRNTVACESNGRKEEQKQEKELLLQRMIEDNERMMGLMAELFERNEIQTKLLSSLTERVHKLEKAFSCEKMRRKKKNTTTTTDSSDKSPDTKRCDKKL